MCPERQFSNSGLMKMLYKIAEKLPKLLEMQKPALKTY